MTAPSTSTGAGASVRPHVEITSPFWRRYVDLVIDRMLPYQWQVINDEIDVNLPPDPGGNPVDAGDTKSHAMRNLRVAAGDVDAPFHGMPFQDSDVYKWLEAVAYALEQHPDPDLQKLADSVVDVIARAQEPDGYLDTYFQLKEPDRRFKRIQQSHELYVMGHYIEAGVAYWSVTGNDKALDIARRMAGCIERNFGDGEGQVHGADGHPEIELALARLAEATGDDRYARLGRWLLRVRGQDPDFYDKQNRADGWDRDFFVTIKNLPRTYYQAAEPIVDQKTADGHAVRVTYLCTGLAHIARLTGDRELAEAAERFWNDIVRKRMYITGQIGSTHVGESFTYDYDLPNDTMYGETCASVGMCFFARRMLESKARGEYGDVMEKELFNGAIAGMSLDGTHFYYVNPLEADPVASAKSPDQAHVLTHRAGWFACACCPANLARLIASIDRYVYGVMDDGTILADQFIASKAEFPGGVTIDQRGDYPWDGEITWSVTNPGAKPQRLGVRVPAWSPSYALTAGGSPVTDAPEDGFVYVEVPAGAEGYEVRLMLDMAVKAMVASNRVREDRGKLAFMRGPIVFCAETADNPAPLWTYRVDAEAAATAEATYDPELLDGVETIDLPAQVQELAADGAELYMTADREPAWTACRMRLVPYYSWANREDGQMSVWLNRA